MAPRGRRISASQVGHYGYCAHAWWLGDVEGYEPSHTAALNRGTAAHERHGWQVSLARSSRRLAFALLGAALLALLAWSLFR
jgi:hypothetical protein